MEGIGAMLESLNAYVRTELIILAPVLYFVIKMLKKTKVKEERIPLYICLFSVGLSGVYIFSTVGEFSASAVLLGIFSSVTQGVLLAGCTLFGAVMLQKFSERKDSGPTQQSGSAVPAQKEADGDKADTGQDGTEQ